jgi:hypothetical protein
VFPVRYELNSFILLIIHLVFKGLRSAQEMRPPEKNQAQWKDNVIMDLMKV